MSSRPSFLLQLLGLSFSLLVTGCPYGSEVEANTKTGAAITLLSPTEPIYRHRVQLHVGPRKRGDSVRVHGVSLSIHVLSLGWKPAEGTTPPVLPWFRLRIFDEVDGRLLYELPVVFDRSHITNPEKHIRASHYLDVSPEKPLKQVDRSFLLEFARQGPPSDGTIDVNWELSSYGFADGDDPLAVTFTFP